MTIRPEASAGTRPNQGLHLTELATVKNSRLESRVQDIARVQPIWPGPTVKIKGDTSPQVSPNRYAATNAMKKHSVIILLLLLTAPSAIAIGQSFPGLRHIVVDSLLGASVNYEPRNAILVMRQFENEAEIRYVDILLARLVPSSLDTFLVQFNRGPSDDPEFSIYRRTKDSLLEIGSMSGLELSIPGTGYLYVSGHTDNMFNTRRKYAVSLDEVREVQQPFYFVGLRSEITRDITIFSDVAQTTPVAVLPKGSKCEVLLSKGDLYLLKTPFGLLGWVQIKGDEPNVPIQGLYFAGD